MSQLRRPRITESLLRNSILHSVGASGIAAALIGCNGGRTAVEVPSYDPSASATKAMEMYDTDGDGFIAGAELEKSPGLSAAKKNFDSNKDDKISAEEIAARVAEWQKLDVGLMQFSCVITLDNAPLDGATITLVPEEFMGDVLQEASDVIRYSNASPVIPVEKRAAPDIPPGVQVGLYKVMISKKQGDKELIPSKYNTETVLGQEVAFDDPGIMNHNVRFTLTSK